MAYFGPLLEDFDLPYDIVGSLRLVAAKIARELREDAHHAVARMQWLEAIKSALKDVDKEFVHTGRMTSRDYTTARETLLFLLPCVDIFDVPDIAEELQMDEDVLMAKLFPDYVPPSAELTRDEKRALTRPWPEGMQEAENLAVIVNALEQ